MKVHHLKVSKHKEAVSITIEQIVDVIQILIDPANHPVFVHCLDGVNITGLAIACLRKLQNWTRASIINEFCKFVGGGEMIGDEVRFLDAFDGEIAIDTAVPAWLWQGTDRLLRHPSIRLSRRVHSQASDALASEPALPDVTKPTATTTTTTGSALAMGDADDPRRCRLVHCDNLMIDEHDHPEYLPLVSQRPDRARHDSSKDRFSMFIRSMALESFEAIAYRQAMPSFDDLDFAETSPPNVPNN